MDKEELERQLALTKEQLDLAWAYIASLSKEVDYYYTRYNRLCKVKEESYNQVIVRVEDAAGNVEDVAGNVKEFNNVIVESFFDMNTLKYTMIIKLKEAENEQNKTK